MNTLTIAFSPEGPTDIRFLSSIIRRTAAELLADHGRGQVDVLEPLAFARSKGELDGAARLLSVGRQAHGFQCLIVHADADEFSASAALKTRVKPGLELIKRDSAACQQVIALVPVTMTETWMLADTAWLQDALDTDLQVIRDLGLPRPGRAEKVAHPKDLLNEALQQIQQRLPARRRAPSSQLMSDLYARLADMPLDSLRRLSSFKRFEADLLTAFVDLNLADL